MARKGLFGKIRDIFRKDVRTGNTGNEEQKEKKIIKPAYVRVQSGEISYEEAVMELTDGVCWILDTAYEAAYPDVYIKGILKTFVSPAKELAFASTFLVMLNRPSVSFLKASGKEISLYDFALEAEKIAGRPLLKDAAWREPFYRFAAELAQKGCLSSFTFETEEEYDSLFHYIGECLQMYAAEHPVNEMGIPLEYIQRVEASAGRDAETDKDPGYEDPDKDDSIVDPAGKDNEGYDADLYARLDEIIDEGPIEEGDDETGSGSVLKTDRILDDAPFEEIGYYDESDWL